MKKQLTTIAALSFAFFCAYAQPVLTEKAAFDDFSTAAEFNDLGTGGRIRWVGQAGVANAITRDYANKQLLVRAVQPMHSYVPFSVSFGRKTIDLSADGTWSFDITNYGTEALFLRVACVDDLGQSLDSDSIPMLPGQKFDDLKVWAYQVQIAVPVGKTVTFKAGTPNGAGDGHLNKCDFRQGVYGDWGTWDPVTQTHLNAGIYKTCDLTKIKHINITPMNFEKDKDNGHALALLDGFFGISNFRIGKAIVSGLNESEISKELFSMFPNPAKNSINLRGIESEVGKSIQIKNSYGQVVHTAQLNSKETTIDISHLQSGLYFVGDKMQKLIVE